MHNLHRIAFWSLAIFVFAIPWERNVAVPGVGAAGTPFGAIAILLGIASVAHGRHLKLRTPSLLLLLFGLFVLWSSLTYFWSINPATTAGRTITYFQLFLMAWLVWQLTRSERDFKILLQGFVLGSLFAIVVLFFNFIRGDATVVSGSTGLTRFSFAGGDPNYFALTLALAIPMAWVLILLGQNRLLNVLNFVYLPVSIIAIGLTGSRGGIVSALIALAVIPVSYWRLGFLRKTALLLALGTMAFGALFIIPDVTFERLLGTPDDIATDNLAGRSTIWRAGLQFLSDNEHAILVGVGSANYGFAIADVLGRARSAHNAYLNVLVENGLIGLVIFLSLFAVALLPNLRSGARIRSFSLFMCLSLAVGIFGLSWEREKPLWFVLALLTTQNAFVVAPTLFGKQSRINDTFASPVDHSRLESP